MFPEDAGGDGCSSSQKTTGHGYEQTKIVASCDETILPDPIEQAFPGVRVLSHDQPPGIGVPSRPAGTTIAQPVCTRVSPNPKMSLAREWGLSASNSS